MKKSLLVLAVVAAVAGLVACGGGGSSSPTAPATPAPTPTPSAAVTATGSGSLVIHPSMYSTWAYAVEVPVRIRETGGGKAKWNYARLQLLKRGREIERAEIGADILGAPPDVSNILPSSDSTIKLYFRLNSVDFDDIGLTLDFTDVNNLHDILVQVPFSSFAGVNVSLVAESRPVPGVERLP
jgi:hypothetical protein